MLEVNEYARVMQKLYGKSLILESPTEFHPVLDFYFTDALAHIDFTLGILAYNYMSPRNIMSMEYMRWRSFVEIPFVFKDREEGKSKLRPDTMVDYLRQCADITRFSVTRRAGPVWAEWEKIVRFGLVGLSGILVNMGLLYALTEVAGLYYLVSAAIAIELSIVSNFVWNDIWTFKAARDLRFGRNLQRFGSFQAVSMGGLVINMGTLYLLADVAGVYYLIANLAGILIAFAWNYAANRHYTWRGA